eukprot:364589-Chlamydomonas_euryale.AAC.15
MQTLQLERPFKTPSPQSLGSGPHPRRAPSFSRRATKLTRRDGLNLLGWLPMHMQPPAQADEWWGCRRSWAGSRTGRASGDGSCDAGLRPPAGGPRPSGRDNLATRPGPGCRAAPDRCQAWAYACPRASLLPTQWWDSVKIGAAGHSERGERY